MRLRTRHMPTKRHENKKKEALNAIQEREAEEIHLRPSEKGQEMGQEVHIPQQEEEAGPIGPRLPYNEFSSDHEYMASMDFAYSKALRLGCKERKEQFWHEKYDTVSSPLDKSPTEDTGNIP